MNKSKIISAVIAELEREFQTVAKAAMEAREAATNEESKPENEYDTRGLEASYLAGAQAKRAGELKEQIQKLKTLQPKGYSAQDKIGSTALVETEIDGEEARLFFMVPFEGGKAVKIDGKDIVVLSLDSPLGHELNGQTVGHAFAFRVKDHEREYEVIDIK